MSLYTEVQFKCFNCSEPIPFTIWQSVNVTLDPEQKSRVLDSSMFFAICPSCGNEHFFPIGFLYHDMDKQIMLFYRDEESEKVDLESAVIANEVHEFRTLSEYKYRVVNELNRLKEKIIIFDENLDDFEIEHY
ncbi:MAG TPA: hypothetical protein GXZ87_07875 [Bacteroidales bacterium]|nr:hypothetical protein [Bacteroidales bacterium]